MTDLLEFPDAAALVTARLAVATGKPTGTKVPNPRPAGGFFVVRRVGGPRLNQVADNATIAVEGWHDTDAQAHDLCQLGRSIVYAMRGTTQDGHAIYRIGEFAGPADLPDPLSSHSRYSCTLTVAVRGVAAEITS